MHLKDAVWMRRRALVLVVLATLALPGCVNALAAVMYVLKGRTVPADFEDLKNRRVAVVCRPLDQLEYASSGAASDIAARLGSLLAQHVKGIDVVEADEIAEWVDENNWDDFTEIGRAVDADMVVAIDLGRFQLYQSQTLYQGRAEVNLRVYDMRRDGEIVYEKNLPQVVYPPNRGIYTQDMQEDQFRMRFIADLSEQIGWIFYPHDEFDAVAKDSSTLE
jgi:hypothetical protein